MWGLLRGVCGVGCVLRRRAQGGKAARGLMPTRRCAHLHDFRGAGGGGGCGRARAMEPGQRCTAAGASMGRLRLPSIRGEVFLHPRPVSSASLSTSEWDAKLARRLFERHVPRIDGQVAGTWVTRREANH